jgi:hypothetical protein
MLPIYCHRHGKIQESNYYEVEIKIRIRVEDGRREREPRRKIRQKIESRTGILERVKRSGTRLKN